MASPLKTLPPPPPASNNFTLPDTIDQHHPNCSAITDDELAETIDGVWPGHSGNATINYIFSLPAFNWLVTPNSSRYHLKNVDTNTVNIFQETVRAIIAEVGKRNNGIFTFKEVKRSFATDYSIFSRGIYYAQTGTVAQFSTDGEGAFTVVRFDNNGYLKRAMINLPIDLEIYQDTNHVYQTDWIEYAISHETYHGFGQQHLQDFATILHRLQNLPDGVFCSVMDYPDIIGTNISQCMQNCTPSFAIYPGSLDIRSMQLAYLQGMWNHDYDKTTDYFYNAIEFCLFFLMITFSYTIIDDVLKSLAFRKNPPFISKKLIHAILNTALLVLFIEMEAPVYIPILFGITMGMQFIREKDLLKIYSCRNESPLKFFMESKFPLYVLFTATIFSDGQLPLPLFLSFLFSTVAVAAGTTLGKLSAYFLSLMINTKLESVIDYFSSAHEVPAEVAVELNSIARPPLSLSSLPIEPVIEEVQFPPEQKPNEADDLSVTSLPHPFYRGRFFQEQPVRPADNSLATAIELIGLAARLG